MKTETKIDRIMDLADRATSYFIQERAHEVAGNYGRAEECSKKAEHARSDLLAMLLRYVK